MQNQDNCIIKSASLKDAMFCHYKYGRVVAKGITDDVTVKSKVPVHADMHMAFKKFNNHMAVICEEVNPKQIKDIDNVILCPEDTLPSDFEKALKGIDAELYRFIVDSVTIDGTGENEGVTLSGTKKLSTGEYITLTTPKITWESEYSFINELRIAADDLIHEVREYMDGKQAPKVEQIDMFEAQGEEGEETGKVFIPGGFQATKRGRKSKEAEQVEG